MGFPTVKAVSGDLVVIYTTNGGGTHPIHGAYLGPNTEWIPGVWTRTGYRYKVSNPHPLDITLEIASLGIKEKQEEKTTEEVPERT